MLLNKFRAIRKQISILLILTLVLVPISNNISFATNEQRVRVTYVPSMLWGGLGQYVEYELDGVKYRTDEASSAINRKAWSLMNQEDRRKTYDRLYTTAAKKAAFGEDGWQDVVSWIRETNEWFIANRMWKEKIAKRDFPELHGVYGNGQSLSTLFSDFDEMKNYIIPAIVSKNNMVREEFVKGLIEVEDYYNVGKEYYNQVKDMRGRSIGKVATFTMMQCTQMLSDMLFLPSISNLATIPKSGLIADVIGVLQTTVGLEGGDILEKLNDSLDGKAVHLTVSEQIKLYESLVKTYAILAEDYYKKVEGKIIELRKDYKHLVAIAKDLELWHQQEANKREEEKNSHQTALDETIVLPPGKEPGQDDPTITLAFKWKTEEELKQSLFNNNLDEWLEFNGGGEIAYAKAAELIFQEIINQKNALDTETEGKISDLTNKIINAYSNILSRVEQLEMEVSTIDKSHSDIIDLDNDLYRIPVGETYFYGDEKFSQGLENFAYQGLTYEFYYLGLREHINEYKEKVLDLLKVVKVLKDEYTVFKENIEKDTQDLVYYLGLLETLEKDYWELYNNAVWKMKNGTGNDTSENYYNISFVNPYEIQDYTAINFDRLLERENLDPDVYQVEELSINRPITVFTKAYDLYDSFTQIEIKLNDAYDNSIINKEIYLSGKTSYYEEMDDRLNEYLYAQEKMEQAFEKIRNIVDEYESSWEGTYFQGSYDNHSYQPYLYGTRLVSISAFDVEGLRSYIRSGGNTVTLHNKLKNIERKAETNEVLVSDLVGQIQSLDFEMGLLLDEDLREYGKTKNKNLENFYILREKYGLEEKWFELTVNTDNSLAYFNTCDISRICEILKGETEEILFLKDAIKEIREYMDKDSVNIYSTSNRLYDIYQKATKINDLYRSNSFNNDGLMTEEQRTEILNLYANPNDGDDIFNNVNEVKTKHVDINYTYPPSPYEGIDEYTPVGELTSKAIIPGIANIKANIYHPFAVNATSFKANLYVYDDGWSLVDTISRSLNDKSADIIDKDKDLLNINFINLEDKRDYRVEWEIVHAPSGTALYENGEYYFTYTSPKGVFTSVELNEETYDSVDIAIINNSDTDLINRQIYIEGYDHENDLILTEVENLNLAKGKKTTISVEFQEVVYQVEVNIEGVENQDPQEFKDWAKEQTVDKYKIWSIKFNSKVDKSTVVKRNIYIKNEKGEIQDITPYLDISDYIVIMNPPEEGYDERYEYTLYITTDVKSIDGRKLTNGIKMKFYIE